MTFSLRLCRCVRHNIDVTIPRTDSRQRHKNNVRAESPEEYYKRAYYIPFLDSFITQVLSVAHEKVPGSLAGKAAVLPGMLGALKRSSGAYLAELPYRSEQIRT